MTQTSAASANFSACFGISSSSLTARQILIVGIAEPNDFLHEVIHFLVFISNPNFCTDILPKGLVSLAREPKELNVLIRLFLKNRRLFVLMF